MPDAFLTDPLGWAGNQAAHALIIGAGAWALLCLWLTRAGAACAVALSYAGWEAMTFRGDLLDAVTDAAFVLAGVGLAWAAVASDRRDLRLIFGGLMLAGLIGVVIRL